MSKADLADHTHTDADDHWTARRVLAFVLEGREYDDRLSAKELAAYVDPGSSAVRDLVGDLRRDFGLAVYSRGSGYWHIQSPEELRDAIHREADKIETKRETIESLKAAYQSTTTMTRTHLPPDQWARAAAGWNDSFFGVRVTQCDDADRLQAAVKYEAERDGETRTDRIARLNKRLQEVRE